MYDSKVGDADFIFEGGAAATELNSCSRLPCSTNLPQTKVQRRHDNKAEFELVPAVTTQGGFEGGDSSQIHLTSKPSVGLAAPAVGKTVPSGGIIPPPLKMRNSLRMSTCEKVMMTIPLRLFFKVCASRSYSNAARKEKLLNLAVKNMDGLDALEILKSVRFLKYLRDKEVGVPSSG